MVGDGHMYSLLLLLPYQHCSPSAMAGFYPSPCGLQSSAFLFTATASQVRQLSPGRSALRAPFYKGLKIFCRKCCKSSVLDYHL